MEDKILSKLLNSLSKHFKIRLNLLIKFNFTNQIYKITKRKQNKKRFAL